MSTLAVLYLVIPFPIAFIAYSAEKVIMQHRWMSAHKESLVQRFPKIRPMIEKLAQRSTKVFATTALVELMVILLATAYVLQQGAYSLELWSALFIAFSVYLLVHVGEAIGMRGYVPGLVSSLLLLPFAGFGMWSIWLAMSGWEMVMWGIIGGCVKIAIWMLPLKEHQD